MGKRWTEDEKQFLREYYAKVGPQECANKLHRSYQAVTVTAHQLQLTKAQMLSWTGCRNCGATDVPHHAKGLCGRCYQQLWQLQQGNVCRDCDKNIQKLSSRCLSCESKNKWATTKLKNKRGTPPNVCIDCGITITRRSTRCVDCYKHHRKQQAQGYKKKPYRRKQRQYPGYVYILEGGGYYKIGSTTKLNDRLTRLSTLMPFCISLMCSIGTEDMFGLETTLHRRFAEKHTNGEWFQLTPEDIEYIKNLT